MIYVSTACVKAKTIAEAVQTLADAGFRRVELSGGTSYYPSYSDDLRELRERYGLSYLCHNYFPPPQRDFVLNLSSADEEVRIRTIDHLRGAVALSREFGCDKFAFHAGFFVDLQVNELGRAATPRSVHVRQDAVQRFCDGFSRVAEGADGVRLYVENNSLSVDHAAAFPKRKPFMLLDSEDVRELRKQLTFNLLLDVGHLKVSCQSLGLRFERECDALIDGTDYLHVSDNDGLRDLSSSVRRGSAMERYLSGKNLKHKTVTLEIYEGIPRVKETFDLMEELVR